MEYISALVLGLLGSFHCIGMCGPIAIALPLKDNSWLSRVLSGLLYNSGRTITYALLGAIFGLLGKGLFLGGFQQWASIIFGIVIILSVLFPVILRKYIDVNKLTIPVVGWLKKSFGKMFSLRSYGSLFTIGILNGFLPCGLVYMAIAGAIVSGEIYKGTIYMAIFGLGTIPVMLSLNLVGNIISLKFRKQVSKVIPYVIIIIGILFILRGMNLGVKYISPKMNKAETTRVECCH